MWSFVGGAFFSFFLHIRLWLLISNCLKISLPIFISFSKEHWVSYHLFLAQHFNCSIVVHIKIPSCLTLGPHIHTTIRSLVMTQ
jgi:hypothetical protein